MIATPTPTPNTPLDIDIAIVGGGIGGLCLAIGLLNHRHRHKHAQVNINIQIYEGAHQFAEIGAGVTVGPNARRALKLLSKGAEEAYLQQATGNGPDFPELRNVYHRFVRGDGPRAGEVISDAWCEDGQQSVHRAKFLDALVRLVPGEIAHFNKRLARLEEDCDAEGRVRLEFEDGSVVFADCVVGCDGVHSVVRKHLVPPDHPSYNPSFAGCTAYRGLIPMEEALAVLGKEAVQIATLYSGHGALIMTYPVDFHKLLNIVAVDTTSKHASTTVEKADLNEMNKIFEGWGPTARAVIGLLNRPETHSWSLWQLSPLPTYTRSRIAIMGDAAHASTPFQGQGAGQAIEDALVLSNLLGNVTSPEDLVYTFQAYDRIRRPRSQKMVRTSREAGDLISFQRPGILDDVAALKSDLDDRFDWLFNRDMQLQIDQAFMMVEEMKSAAKQ